MTRDILSFKTTHLISTLKRCYTRFTTRNSILQNFKRNCHVQRNLPGIPVMNKTHPIPTYHLILGIRTFVLSSNQYVAAQSVQWIGYMLEEHGMKSWQKQENYLFSKTPRPAPAPNQPPTQWKPDYFLRQLNVRGRQSDHSHLSTAKFKNQRSHTST